MESLINFKKKYNALLERNSKAEKYIETHNPEECLIKKFKGKSALDGFNDVAVELSKTKKQVETLLYRNMTEYEILNGFKI